jgi:hypothetical protein
MRSECGLAAGLVYSAHVAPSPPAVRQRPAIRADDMPDMHTVLTQVVENARCITQALRLQSAVKYVERIGDHVTYLGEMVVLMVRGEDAPHAASSGDSVRVVPNHERN